MRQFNCPPQKQPPKRKFGRNPPDNSLGTAPSPEDRIPPTWGSNLLMVQDDSKERCPSCGTGQDESNELFGLAEGLDYVEQFVGEFSRGEMDRTFRNPRIAQRPFRAGGASPSDKGKGLEFEENTEYEDSEMDFDFDTSGRSKEIKDDSQLIDYFRQQVNQTAAQQHISKLKMEGRTASPARAGIPLTTPRSSPSPKRSNNPQWLYEELADRSKTERVPQELNNEDLDIIEYEYFDKYNEIEQPPVFDEFEEWNRRIKTLTRRCVESITQTDEDMDVDE